MTNGQQPPQVPAQVQAATGNSMIPSNPEVGVQQLQQGAQQITPQQVGAPAVEPAPQVDSQDFWGSIERQIEPGLPPAQQAPTPPPEPVVQPQVAIVPPGQPVAPAQVPEPQLTPEQLAVVTEATALEQGFAQPQPQAVPQPVAPAASFEEQTIANLAQTEYALPEEAATKMMTNPEEVFPLYAARLHVRLATQIGQAVQQILPGVIDRVVTARMQAQTLENDFFRTYPQLSNARFRPVVAQSLRMARQASPQAGRDQIMQDGAALAAMKLRISPQGQPAQQPVAQPQIPVAPVQPQPFAPALPGGGSLPIQQPAELQNEFAQMANDPNW